MRGASLLLAIVGMALAIPRAEATAWAGVNRAFVIISNGGEYIIDDGASGIGPFDPWGVTLVQTGVAISEFSYRWGNASIDFSFNETEVSGSATASANGYAYGRYSAQVSYELRNQGSSTFDFIGVFTGLSSFNPGGNWIGAEVDNPLIEYARFSSMVSANEAMDFHGCETTVGVPACGVMSPDENQFSLYFVDFRPGEALNFLLTYYLEFEVRAGSVPAPGVASLLTISLAGLFATAARRRHRGRDARQS